MELSNVGSSVVEIRVKNDLMIEILKKVGKGKPYPTKSEAIRSLVLRGIQFEDYLKIINDPEAMKNSKQTLQQLQKYNMDSKYIETLDTVQFENLWTIMKIAKEQRVKQDLLNF